MQSHYSESQATHEALLGINPHFGDTDSLTAEATEAIAPVRFHGQFEDCMEMNADPTTVAEYLALHNGWFCRCAHPMKVQPLGNNGYALTIGRFGSYGYEVEPKIGLELMPPDAAGVYRIQTIPVPDYIPCGYDVDFNATLELREGTVDESAVESKTSYTRVEWQLDLVVAIQFPRFIYKLPMSLIQGTGDRVLQQIVRQVSHRLTYKVQQDFHTSLGLEMTRKSKKR